MMALMPGGFSAGGGSMQKLFVANVNIFREPSIIAKKSARLQDVPSELNF